ncbi:UNVERIFIED_CONTAM: hypothetical protein Sradi_3989600 [Sesamum radiatum]|uniref:Reverse transcriptase zinc-binding domain-containing protein n=1 Tax=Sesamum radiatum TaxID=300843 RepID=A0AAW2PGR7_SESRA
MDGWNEALIRAEFCSDDAVCILDIKLPGADSRDELVWHYGSNGTFSVNSAYSLAVELNNDGACSQSGASWNYIWNSKAIPKVLLFGWRCVQEALPTSVNLSRKGIPIADGCVHCSATQEDILHVLVLCCFARLVWAVSGLPGDAVRCPTTSVEGWFRRTHGKLSRSEWKLFLSICWALWRARNSCIFDGKRFEAHEIVGLARRIGGGCADALVHG